VREPIGEEEGLLLREVAIVEHEQELAAIALESLNRVRDARREVPQLALADVVLKCVTVLIDGGDAGAPFELERPLGGLVPMRLQNGAALSCMLTPASSVATGSSRAVVCRPHPPDDRCIWLSARTIGGSEGVVVRTTGTTMSGFCASGAGFDAPRIAAPRSPLIG
jgi:hypothetical protein